MTVPVDSIDEPGLRRVFAHYPTGVAVVAAIVDGLPVGMTVSSFLSVSLDPPLVSISVSRTSTTWAQLRNAPSVGVSILAEHQEHISRRVSSKSEERFDSFEWETRGGAVFIQDAVLRLDCAVDEHFPAGDHELVLLRICGIDLNPSVVPKPLVFHGSSYRRLSIA